MKDQEIEKYWRDKEEEYQSTLVKASVAQYLVGYQKLQGPVHGLLYIMKNGIYFENFKKEHWLDKVFRVEKNFSPVFFQLKNEHITDVSCFPGQKNKFKIPFGKQMAFFLGLLPQHLLVEYQEGGETCVVRFACVETPLSLCAAYYKACRESVSSAE